MRNEDAAGREVPGPASTDVADRLPDDDRGSTVQSVDRAVTILELLAQHGTLGVTALARELGVHKSTASRLVAALERRGLVEQVEDRGHYRIGVGILRLGRSTSARLDVAQQARPICRELAASTGDTVNLAILDGAMALYIDQISGPDNRSTYNWVGQRIPLHATSNGKALISEHSAEQVRELIPVLKSYTERTVTDHDELGAQLDVVRVRGYSIARDELDIGLTALAVPIRNAHGEVVASISVSGPTFRMDDEHLATLADPVRQAAATISSRLGWLEPKGPPPT